MGKTQKKAAEKRPYHRGNVAEDLTAAALRLLKTERYEDLSVRRLTREIGEIMKEGDVRERCAALMLEAASSGPDELRAVMQTDIARLRALRDSVGIKVD